MVFDRYACKITQKKNQLTQYVFLTFIFRFEQKNLFIMYGMCQYLINGFHTKCDSYYRLISIFPFHSYTYFFLFLFFCRWDFWLWEKNKNKNKCAWWLNFKQFESFDDFQWTNWIWMKLNFVQTLLYAIFYA